MRRRKKSAEPRMLRAGIKPRRAMEVFDKTFKFVNQHPPHMRAYEKDPSVAFMVDAYALIAQWPAGVMRGLLRSLTRVEPDRNSSGLIGQVKRLLHEVMDDRDIAVKDGRTHFARWKDWPHIRVRPEKVIDSTRSKELTEEERVEMSKQAVKKKVASVKRTASVKKTSSSKRSKPAVAAKKRGNGKVVITDATFVSKIGVRAKGGGKTKLLNLITRKGSTVAALATAAEKEGIPKKKVVAWLPFLQRYNYVKIGK